MTIKTPVQFGTQMPEIGNLMDADGNFVGTIAAEYIDDVRRALNTHAALRASHAEMVEVLKLSIQWSPYKGESEETPFLRRARTALSNAAKVEVGQ